MKVEVGAPIPNKPTVSVDVKQHSTNQPLRLTCRWHVLHSTVTTALHCLHLSAGVYVTCHCTAHTHPCLTISSSAWRQPCDVLSVIKRTGEPQHTALIGDIPQVRVTFSETKRKRKETK